MRKHKDQSVIMEGVSLYKSLNETNRVIVVADDRERASIWMKTNNLAKKIDDIYQTVTTVDDDARLTTVESLRSRGKVDYVLTEDPEFAKKLLENGISVLVFLNPRYTRPEFRPDGRLGAKSWTDITDELDKQQGLYDEDRRLKEEDELEEVELDL
jgi:hypothetical protein